MMTIKYGLHFFFVELTANDGQNFLAGIVTAQIPSKFILNFQQQNLIFSMNQTSDLVNCLCRHLFFNV
jgi:hypothetical protein